MYNGIIQELSGINKDDIVKIVLSKSKSEVKKTTIRPILLKSGRKWQTEKIKNNQAFHSNIEYNDLENHLLSLLEEYGFSEIYFILKGKTISYRVSKKKKLFRNEHETEVKGNIVFSHDVPKKYILEEGVQIPPLVDLGIFDGNFRVKKSMYDKYKQINRFVEIIADEFKDYDKDELTIVEFGCGKSYLTFIIYYYFAFIKKINVKITGFDLKDEVVKHCNAVAGKYNYKNIRFITGDISKIETCQEHTDMIITLHACDTATDYALYFAIKNKIKYIFSVPCCQHEVNKQISNKNEFSILLRHGLYKERFSAILTDAIRCEVLQDHGYEVDVVEFVDFENTPKNAMIRAKLKDKHVPPRDNVHLKKLVNEFNINPTILRLINN
ncbi:MAG TPA: SAM-dependent methyltransferase [Clostridiaceae bacterium]|nr:SAM-dependent methyltransferase [Clostridiaceae bacterium]